jgi:hypothetical protein
MAPLLTSHSSPPLSKRKKIWGLLFPFILLFSHCSATKICEARSARWNALSSHEYFYFEISKSKEVFLYEANDDS